MIIAVAIRTKQRTYELPRPCRHHHVLHMMANTGRPTPVEGEQGFIDDQRGFVTREEAAQIALNQGQVAQLHAPPNLFSEDLW